MKFFISLFLLFILFISCNTEGIRIDLQNSCENAILTAEDIFDTIEFIPLETNKNCLLRNPSVFGLDGDSVLIWDGNNIFRFLINGKYLNRIGTFGNGHGEHGRINSANLDLNRKRVLLGSPEGIIYKYDYNGNYIGQICLTFKDELLQAVKWSSEMDCFVCEVRKYSETGLTIFLRTFSYEGKLITSYEVYKDNDSSVKLNMLKTGMLRNGNNGVYFKIPFDNKLYFLSQSGLTTSLEFDLGKYSPTRRDIEDVDYFYKNGEKKKLIDNIVIGEKYIFLSCIMKNDYQEYVIDRKTNTIKHCSFFKGNNPIYLSVNRMEKYTFWPWVSLNEKFFDIVPIEQFTAKELQQIGIGEQTDSQIFGQNPVLVIAYH